jgi:ParB family chromosome partitioning protein
MTTDPKKRLGRGLESLLPTKGAPAPVSKDPTSAPIEDVHPNRAQPRSRFDEAALDELAASIRAVGVLEPILVRKRPATKDGAAGFEIIAGERRWRAAQRAGLREVPIVVREFTTEAAFEAAIIENVQREDLNPIEAARAFQRLVDEFGYTQDSIAERLGKDRSSVANSLRLLKLPAAVLEHIENGELSEGHGRALLTAGAPALISKLAAEAIARGWSVRETERQARSASAKPSPKPAKSANIRDLENRLSRALGARVAVNDDGAQGSIAIRYTSHDELDRLLQKLIG